MRRAVCSVRHWLMFVSLLSSLRHQRDSGRPSGSCMPAWRSQRELGAEVDGLALVRWAALWGLASVRCLGLPRDGNTESDLGSGGIRFTIGIMVDAPEEVDQLTEQMRNVGARVAKEPVDAEFFTGRSAYLCDPEGNYYEITWAEPNNPITSRRTTRA
jgi:hypothetical protein